MRLSAAIAVAVSLAVLAAAPAGAQGPPPPPHRAPTPEQLQQMDMMGPAMARMTESMYAGMLRAMAKPETAEQLATFMKNYRDALIAKGFTKDEAMQIVKGAGMPTMPMTR